MKKLKLNYLAFSLVALTICSCASEDIIENDTNTAKETTDSFYFDANIDNYEVDGKIVYDRELITNAAKDAWHIMWDYPLSKVVISTTKQEFEKFKNVNLDYKASLEGQLSKSVENESTTLSNNLMSHSAFDNRALKIMELQNNAKNITASASLSRTGTGVITENPNFDITNYPHENDTDDVVLHISLTNSPPELVYYNHDLITKPNTASPGLTNYTTSTVGSNAIPVTTQGTSNTSTVFSLTRVRNSGTIANHSRVRKVIALFSQPNYTGMVKTIVLDRSRTVVITNQLLFGTQAARSIRVDNANFPGE